MSLTVTNKSRTLFTLNLPKGLDYENHPAAAEKTQTFKMEARTKEGDVGIREVEKTIPGSMTWLSGETKTKLPPAIACIPEFQQAVAQGILVVVS